MIKLDVQDLRDMQCEAGSLDLQSMDASTLSLTFARVDAGFIARWVYGERIRLSDGSLTLYEGWIKDIDHAYSAGSRRVTVTAYDKWDDDGKNIYFANEDTTAGYIGKATPSSTVYVDDAIKDVLKLGGANIASTPGVRSEMVPFATASETRLNALKKIGRWVPNLVSRTDYAIPPDGFEPIRTVTVTTPRELAPVVLDVRDILTEDIQLKPRYDLCPSSVSIIRHWTDSLGYNHTATWTVPEGGNPHAVDAYVFETNDTAQGDNEEAEEKWGTGSSAYSSGGIGSNGANSPKRMTIKGRHIPDKNNIMEGWTTNEKFWGEYFPILKGLGTALEWGQLRQQWKPYDQDEPDTGASDSEAAKAENRIPPNYGNSTTPGANGKCRYVLFEGEISDQFKGVRYVNATLECWARIKSEDQIPAGHDRRRIAAFFAEDDAEDDIGTPSVREKSLRRRLAIDCVLIDRFQASYLETADCPEVDPAQEDYPTDEDKEEAEKAIPADYSAAAEAYYNATRDLQYDGSITIRQVPAEAIKYIGCHLAIKGALKEWETMCTTVQSVGIDLMTGSVSLTLGARDQEFETPKARNLTKEAREITEDERTTGNMAGSGGGSLADTNRTEEEKKDLRSKTKRVSSPAISGKVDTKDDPREYHRRPFEVTTRAAGYKSEEGYVHGITGEPVKVEARELSPESSDWYLVYKVNRDKSINSAQISDRKATVHSYDEVQSTGAWPATYCIHLCHIENMCIAQKWTGDVYFDGSGRHIMPFELYRLGDKWVINGGKVVSPMGHPMDMTSQIRLDGVIATPGEWYVNYRVPKSDKFVAYAEISKTPYNIHMFDVAYLTNVWPATYCVHIATVKDDGTVVQRQSGDVYFEAELYPPGGGGSTVPGPYLSIVPGPGIDAERSDGYADDGAHIIRYDIKGRLSQYRNHVTPDEQGDITGVSVYLNPLFEPRREAGAHISDGHILISIVPGPITRVKAGANISVAESRDYEDGWPVLTYTVSTTKDGGELISIVPGPGIAVETTTGAMADGTPYVQHRISGLTARYGQPGADDRQGDMTGAEIAINPSFDPTPACRPSIIDGVLTVSIVPGPKTIVVAGENIAVAETRSEVNGWPVLAYTVSAKGGGGIVPGEASDPDRPPTGYNTDQMRAFGWTKVSGYWADPTGHAHQCFMAVRGGKLFFHMFPSGFDS